MKIIQIKRRPKILCYATFFVACSVTALVYYFFLVRQLEQQSDAWIRGRSSGSVSPPFSSLVHSSNSRNEEITQRLVALETGLKENGQVLDMVRKKVIQVSNAIYSQSSEALVKDGGVNLCNIMSSGRSDVRISDVYNEISFEDTDGGVWKQGWEIQLNKSRLGVNGKKLKVFVVPHSHNDPGWVKTFEQYFEGQTRHILNHATDFLDQHPDMKFIWAETSYFAFWWGTIDDSKKQVVKKLINSGQLEIVTGGWVMNDEANTHYFSMIEQMVEGHEWLRINLGQDLIEDRIKNGWAIDPFGMSSTMAFLLKRMNFDAMVLQRVHYSIKKYLAQNQMLEFKWRQFWESSHQLDATSNPGLISSPGLISNPGLISEVNQGKFSDPTNERPLKGDILAHMMPFYSYDVPHTCGPDPKVCCQFDFRRMPPFKINSWLTSFYLYLTNACPWKVPPQKITESNVESRAKLLLEQYQKKGMIYRTNSVLIPLGDDFRYENANEWKNQYENYKALFDFMNSNKEWNVEVKFATLSEYFQSVFDSVNDGHSSGQDLIPSLTGDFFTYADREDHYWSGYYTSRPFYKRLDRILQSYLRSSEILYSFASILGTKFDRVTIQDNIENARQNLALFQHHDAITGTAREAVVNDYAMRMHKSLLSCQNILSRLTESFLDSKSDDTKSKVEVLQVFPDQNSLPRRKMISFPSEYTEWSLLAYNSLEVEREEYLCFNIDINVQNWVLKDSSNQIIDVQVNYLWNQDGTLVTDRVEACFMAPLPPLSITPFKVEKLEHDLSNSHSISTIELYNFDLDQINLDQYQELIKKIDSDSKPAEISIQSNEWKLVFSSVDGMLRRVIQLDHANGGHSNGDHSNGGHSSVIRSHEVKLSFMTFSTTLGRKDHRSGAYLFLPDKPEPTEVKQVKEPKIRVIRGPLCSKVEVLIDSPVRIDHEISLLKSSKFIDVANEFHLVKGSSFGNKELLLRIETELENGDEFYTDLNGFQMSNRRRYNKIPVQGNVYPVPTLMYIQDKVTRFNILTGQPLGGISPKSGIVDIFMDRKLLQDDNRGLGQGLQDNKRTRLPFKVFFESVPSESMKPSQDVQLELLSLNNPVIMMESNVAMDTSVSFMSSNPFPCDVHLVNFRTATQAEDQVEAVQTYHMTLHRFGTSCETKKCSSSTVNLSRLLSDPFISRLKPMMMQVSLSFLKTIRKEVSISEDLIIHPMDLAVYALQGKD